MENKLISSKILLSKILKRLGLIRIFYAIQKMMFQNNFIRIINYHDTPEIFKNNFEKQLVFLKDNYSDVTFSDFGDFIKTKNWKKSKPGIILSFDDGLRSNYDTALPLLEKYGFTGWFLIPTDFVETDVKNQKKFADDHQIVYSNLKEDRIALSWNEVKKLDKKHVIACHTASHYRFSNKISEKILQDEISAPKKLLEKKLKHDITIFCWVGGELNSYNRKAAEFIKKSGFKYAFQTNSYPVNPKSNSFHLQRINVEIEYPVQLLEMLLSGLYDWIYIPKRKRVSNITNV